MYTRISLGTKLTNPQGLGQKSKPASRFLKSHGWYPHF